MQTITTIGLDIAKSVFQVHGVDAAGEVVIRRQWKRRYVLAFFEKLRPCLVGIEACASSHYWSRELPPCLTSEIPQKINPSAIV
jgi:transposase